MGNPLSDIAAGGVKGLAEAFDTVLSEFHLSPEQKATIEQAKADNAAKMAELDANYKVKLLESDAAENESAGANVRAEASSGDPVVRRARPMIIWVGLFIMAWNYCLIPLIPGKVVVSFPDMFWYAWIVVATGYVAARTGDKAIAAGMILPGLKVPK